ncbi:MAG TPA: RNA polymerase sigma factor [Micavibrio sp.]|jgi:RNA polymerase sigma-70 factor (ECF subfamily)
MDEIDDHKLAAMAKAGDARAFEALIERHYDSIFRMAFSWSRNRSDAEDIAQTVCVKLARAIQGFSGKSKFTTWLYRIVVNTAIDWRRQNKRSHHIELDEQSIATEPQAETQLLAKEILARIDLLPEKEKTALLLAVVEEMSHADIAAIMGVKQSTVSWYVHEARKKLGIRNEKKERRHG